MPKTYHIGTWDSARRDFGAVFGVSIVPFYDGKMTVVSGKICIDTLKFDDFLHREFGEYEDRGLSMRDLIFEKYGKQGCELLEALS